MANIEKRTTKAEYIADMAAYLEEAEKQVSVYNQAQTQAAANQAEAAAKAAIKAYNDCALRVFLFECLESAGELTGEEASHAVMVSACQRHTYSARAITISAASDDVKTMEIAPRDKVVDLTKFNRSVVSLWFYRAELLTEMLTRDIASGIGYSGKKLTDAMQFFKLSKEALEAPKISKSALKKALPEIIAAMIGESYKDKVLPCDVNYLVDKFVVGGKSMVVKVASVKQCVALLCDIAHRVLTDGFYTIEGKELKAKKK